MVYSARVISTHNCQISRRFQTKHQSYIYKILISLLMVIDHVLVTFNSKTGIILIQLLFFNLQSTNNQIHQNSNPTHHHKHYQSTSLTNCAYSLFQTLGCSLRHFIEHVVYIIISARAQISANSPQPKLSNKDYSYNRSAPADHLQGLSGQRFNPDFDSQQ